jgi:hypothetical protein
VKGTGEHVPPRGTILFIHPSDEAYGADRVLLQAILGLRDRGWDCQVILADDSAPGWLSERLAEAGVTFARGPLAPARRQYLKAARLPAYARDLRAARRYVRREACSSATGYHPRQHQRLLVGR